MPHIEIEIIQRLPLTALVTNNLALILAPNDLVTLQNKGGKIIVQREIKRLSDLQIRAWAKRHGLTDGMTDLRCAFEDARTL